MAEPASVAADGNVKVVWATAIASVTAPTAAECNAGTSKDVSCYLTDDGWTPTLDEGVVTDNRLCSKKTYERPGRQSDHLTIQYIYNILSAPDDVARLALTEGNVGFFIVRFGVLYSTSLAAADVVGITPGVCGAQMMDKPTANGVLTITQRIFIPAPGVQRFVTVAA